MAIGIQNLMLAATIVATVGNTYDQVMADGKVSASDITALPTLFPALTGLFQVKYSELYKEVSDLDASEKGTLAQHFKNAFDLADNDLEAILEEGLDVVFDGLATIQSALAMLAKLKARRNRPAPQLPESAPT